MTVSYCIRLNVAIALVYSQTNEGIKSKCQIRAVHISLPYWENNFSMRLLNHQMSSACTYIFLIHHLCKIIDVRFNFYFSNILKSLDNVSVNMNCLSSDYPNLLKYLHIRVYASHVTHTAQKKIWRKISNQKCSKKNLMPYRYGGNRNDINNILHLIVSVLNTTCAILMFGNG